MVPSEDRYKGNQPFLLCDCDAGRRRGGCGIGSCGVPRPSLAPYVAGTGPKKVRSFPEATDFRGTRSKSQIPTLFPHRFPVNSRALTSVEGALGQDDIEAAIQTTSTSKVRRVDFGGCGPSQPSKFNHCPRQAARARPSNSSSNALASWSNPVGDPKPCSSPAPLVQGLNMQGTRSRVSIPHQSRWITVDSEHPP